jgi:Domain of unknown function (DUF5667)
VKERDEMVNLVDALDDVLARVATGESLEGCLARYASRNLAVELAELVGARDRLSALAPVPAVPADTLAARRRQFLATARTTKRQAVSVHPFQRFMAWVWPAQRTGRPAFVPATLVARVAIAFVLVLSIVGGTVAAAQSSLPDSPVYRIKLAVEDARLNLTRDPSQQATLAMTFASERAHEMERLAIANRPISAQVSLRLQSQLDAALNAAARAPGPEMLRLLEEVRTTAQTQERALAQAQVNAPREASTQDALRLAEQAVTLAQQQAEAGLADPDVFRRQYRRGQDAPVQLTPLPEATTTPQPQTSTTVPQRTATLEATAKPQPSHTPQASDTPQRNQAGTGQPPTGAPGPQVTGTPQQSGPGLQPTAGQAGPGPQATDTPEGYPGGKPGGGSGSGGNGGGTRRP